MPADKIEAFKIHFQCIVENYAAVTFSGSLPPGVPSDFYAQLIDIAHTARIPVFLDTSGEALKQGVICKPVLIKPNRKEVTDLADRGLKTLADFAHVLANVTVESYS